MLFSNDTVANFINEHFEPAWESVRPVPMVTIDFGNGKVVRRTLHGNVATYACLPDGNVLDVLPGIYEPQAYLDRLDQLRLLNALVSGSGRRLESALADYHRRQFDVLTGGGDHLELTRVKRYSIRGAETGTLIALQPARRLAARAASASADETKPNTTSRETLSEGYNNLANWDALARDTEINEQVRRKAIHENLADTGLVQPDDIVKWLYREVLHADLDDPYLGLSKVLFENYPFSEEDR